MKKAEPLKCHTAHSRNALHGNGTNFLTDREIVPFKTKKRAPHLLFSSILTPTLTPMVKMKKQQQQQQKIGRNGATAAQRAQRVPADNERRGRRPRPHGNRISP